MIKDEMDLVRQLKDVPPPRPEAYERARATLGRAMVDTGAQERQRYAWTRLLKLSLPARIGVGVVGAAAAAAVAFTAIPATTPGTTPGTGGTAQAPQVDSPLVSLAANVQATASSQTGDASLVVRHRTAPDGTPEVTYSLYTDKGEVYYSEDQRALSRAIAHHDNLAEPMDARTLAAARAAAKGDLAKARQDMVNATTNYWGLGLSPEDAQKVWAKGQAEAVRIMREKGVKDAAPRPRPTGKALDDGIANSLWTNSLSALARGGANAEVRAGVLRLISTIQDVKVTDSTTDGRPSLTLTAGAAVFNGDGTNALTIDAKTGLPISDEWRPDGGKGTPVVEAYKSSRVTVADVAAGKF